MYESDICKEPKSDGEKSLCACYKATVALQNTFKLYDEQYKNYKELNESYKRWKADWNEWKERVGKYAQYKNHGVNNEFWANDVDGTCWWGENWNAAHKWCKWMATKKGYDGENYWAKKWGMCKGRRGNFLCGKTEETNEKQKVEYEKAQPKSDKKSHKYWLGISEPVPPNAPTGNNIVCCAQLFDDISVQNGNADFSKIAQDCSLKIINKLKNPSSPNHSPSKPHNNSSSKPPNNSPSKPQNNSPSNSPDNSSSNFPDNSPSNIPSNIPTSSSGNSSSFPYNNNRVDFGVLYKKYSNYIWPIVVIVVVLIVMICSSAVLMRK